VVGNVLLSVVITGVLAIVVYAWVRRRDHRLVTALRAWAEASGWRARPGPAPLVLPSTWPDYPAAAGNPLLTLDGQRQGYPLILQWVTQVESRATACYVTLHRDHATTKIRRHALARYLPPEERHEVVGRLSPDARAALRSTAAHSWQLSGRYLVAVRDGWLAPDRIESLLQDVTTVAAAIDGSLSE